jgi:hypothetical protein
MKFSDLKNPTAASAVIKDFQKRFSAKVCLAPTGGCSGGIISAHTLSAEGMLRPISRDGHVYAVKTNIYNPIAPATIGLLGIRDTSVFNGFCATHDKTLFSPVEDQPFACTPQQLFTHAYRAIAKEMYLKRRQAESMPSPDDVKEIHGLPNELGLHFSEDALLSMAASLRGAEELERTKTEMDKHLVAGDWRRVMTTVIPFSRAPTVVCSFVYSPDHDFEGNYLQDFENWEVDLSQLMVTIIPAISGGFGGFALLSHLDTANSAPRKLIESLTTRKNLTSNLLWLLFCHTENFAISPTWYEMLTGEQSAAIKEAFFSNVDPFEAKHNQLRECKLMIENWEPGKPFSL